MMATEGKVDWRIEIDKDIGEAAGAIAGAYGMTRAQFTEKVFSEVINKIAHRHIEIQQRMRGNPLLSEPVGTASEFGGL